MSTTLSVLNNEGSESATIELDAGWLERERGEQAVHDSVVSYLGRKRAGTAKAKGRSEVRGTGSKPYRQKGTGRARAGSVKSPLWRGGGVIFGPSPRSFGKRTNRKAEKLALRRAFTERVDAGDVIVVDAIEVAEPKTRAITQLLKRLDAGENVLILVDEITPELGKSARNLASVDLMKASAVNTYMMLLYGKVVITQAGLEALGKRMAR